MSEAKFTKGEWKAVNNGSYWDVGFGSLGNFLMSMENKWLSVDKAQQEANANLIACAPDMYEMLDSVRSEMYQLIDEVNDQRASRINSTTETEPDYHDQETLHLIDKLLAKARGEA